MSERWPEARLTTGEGGRATIEGFGDLPIDHGVGPVDWIGGESQARARLTTFLEDRLPRYADDRTIRTTPW